MYNFTLPHYHWTFKKPECLSRVAAEPHISKFVRPSSLFTLCAHVEIQWCHHIADRRSIFKWEKQNIRLKQITKFGDCFCSVYSYSSYYYFYYSFFFFNIKLEKKICFRIAIFTKPLFNITLKQIYIWLNMYINLPKSFCKFVYIPIMAIIHL